MVQGILSTVALASYLGVTARIELLQENPRTYRRLKSTMGAE